MDHPDPAPGHRRFTLFLVGGLLALAALAMGLALRNEFVQDDTGIISKNPYVHSLDSLPGVFARPYWPELKSKELYRPLAIAGFTLQWWLGDGAPWVFHLFNLLAYGAAVLAVWALLVRITSPPAAWVGTAIFAVHPVHVEAVAVSVNQGETVVAALLCMAAAWYLDWRRGTRSTAAAWGAILLVFTGGLFFKEHALVLPGLLVALEISVVDDPGGWRARIRRTAPFQLTLLVIAAVFWLIRGQVLGGGSGTAPMEILRGLTFGGRALTMLGVVPEWVRLLLWPAHLQSEWAPLEYVPYYGWTLRETLGAIALGALLLATLISWRRRPVAFLAFSWLAIAIFPVSNLLLPTGVVIAERTLFLPSVALAILVADGIDWWSLRPWHDQRAIRVAAAVGLGLLLGAGILRSTERMITWRNRGYFLAAQVHDAPLSYRAHLSWGILLYSAGDSADGAREVRRAWDLHFDGIDPFFETARKLQREDGQCAPALVLYERLIDRLPERSDVRAGYAACATWLGQYDVAASVLRGGAATGNDLDYWRRALVTVDSAARVHAPLMTVHLPALPGDWVSIGKTPATDAGG